MLIALMSVANLSGRRSRLVSLLPCALVVAVTALTVMALGLIASVV